MRGQLKSYFITGLLIFIPLVGTIYIIWVAFIFFDGILRPLIKVIIPWEVPGLSLVVTILIILTMGVVTTLATGKKALEIFEDTLSRVPVISGIYSVVKQTSSVFLSQREGRFKTVVLVEYPRKGLYSIAFTAGASVDVIRAKTAKETVNVFIPSTPNPTTGFLIMVPAKDVMPIDLTVDEAMRVILSGGFMDFQKNKEKNKT
ncbi:MAG: DUF502 domain-containing protein [Candidatus Hydrothermarchaeaceae archaeon]